MFQDVEADDVVSLLARLSAEDARAWVAGGWAVDALLGRPTRRHHDLDLAVDAEQLDQILAVLAGLGYAPREDWLPVRIELEDDGRRVDLRPLRFAQDGGAVQAGLDDAEFFYAAVDRLPADDSDGDVLAMEYSRGGLNTDLQFVWLPYLQRTLTACNDLDCSALW